MALLLGFLVFSGHAEFYLHKKKYESIVQLVKAAKLPATGLWVFRVDNLDNPVLSRESKPEQPFKGQILAVRTHNNKYTILIVASDRGSLGTIAYVYSEISPAPMQKDVYPQLISQKAVESMFFKGPPLGKNWWIAYNNSIGGNLNRFDWPDVRTGYTQSQ